MNAALPDQQDVLLALKGEASRMGVVCLRRSLGHRRACNAWNAVNMVLGLPSVVLAAAAGTSAFAAAGKHHVLAGVLALAAAVLSALTTFLNPAQSARLHQHAAASYGALEGQFRRFGAIEVLVNRDLSTLQATLEDAIAKFDEVDAASPPIPAVFRHQWGRFRGGHVEGRQQPAL